MIRIPIVLFGLLTFFGSTDFCYSQCKAGLNTKHSPVIVGDKIIDNLLARKGYMVYHSGKFKVIHYADACAGFGAARLAAITGDTFRLNKIHNRYRHAIDSGYVNYTDHVDACVYGIVPLELYIQKKDKKQLQQGVNLADIQWKNPRPDGLSNQTRLWIDDIWMIGSLQVQAYRATKNPVYIERAAKETAYYIKRLQQSNGLFFHGDSARFFWGRGNGWCAAGLAEILSELPQSNEYYQSLLKGYKIMMGSLVQYQCSDGMWRQLVDVDSSYEESSATAMFGYAICMGVKKHILTGEKYTTAYKKAWSALCDKIDKSGNLTGICVGTGQSDDINYYLNRPVHSGDLHGQAPMLWFAWAMLME